MQKNKKENSNEELKKNIYHIHDKSYKDLYSKKEIAVDLFKNFVKKEFTKDLKAEDLTLIDKSFVTSDYEEIEADIVYRADLKGQEVIFYILLEFQSSVDYRMPLRLLFYICEILRDDAKNAKHNKNDKKLKIPAVIPIVLYNGKSVWDVPNELRKITYNEELFDSGLLNFSYDIFDINNGFTKEQLVNSKNITAMIFLLEQKIEPIEFLNRIKQIALFFDGISKEEMLAIKHWIRNTVQDDLANTAIKILESDKEERETMVANNAFILDEMKLKAIREGRQQGIEQGIEQGKIEVAISLLDLLDDETISKRVGLDLDLVKKLRKENMQK